MENLSRYQSKIMEKLEDGGHILVYSSRLDLRCILIMPGNESETIRFDTFAKLVDNGSIEKISGETPFNSWVGKWAIKNIQNRNKLN